MGNLTLASTLANPFSAWSCTRIWKDHALPGKREGKGFWLWCLLKLLVIGAPRVLRRLVASQAPCYTSCKGILAEAASPRPGVQPPWTPWAIRHFPEGPDSFIGIEVPPPSLGDSPLPAPPLFLPTTTFLEVRGTHRASAGLSRAAPGGRSRRTPEGTNDKLRLGDWPCHRGASEGPHACLVSNSSGLVLSFCLN